MREKPILFSSPMVRATLSGSKTQTRRVVKQDLQRLGDGDWYAFDHKGINYRVNARHTTIAAWAHLLQFCPYGQPGDRLWVRETFRVSKKHDATTPRDLPFDRGLSIAYSAGGMMCRDEVGGPYISHPNDDLWDADWMGKTRVSIHMPRAASRITLEIVSVRVERLQDISEEDAAAEGIYRESEDEIPFNGPWYINAGDSQGYATAKSCYEALWDSINSEGSWEKNPWVWVIEFRRIM